MLIDGIHVETEKTNTDPAKEETLPITQEQALQTFTKTLASPETTSIAKIRQAAQKLLEDTEGIT